MIANIEDEFHCDDDVDNNNSINNDLDKSFNINQDTSINNNVDKSLSNLNEAIEEENMNNQVEEENMNNQVEEDIINNQIEEENINNNMDENTKKRNRMSKAKKKEENDQKKEEKRETFKKAIKDLRERKFKSINKCAQAHGVPSSTLRDLYRSGQDYQGPGRRVTIFTEEEEKKIVNYIRHQCKYGFGLSFFELRRVIEELAEGLKAANPKRKFPESWEELLPEKYFVYNFAKRHLLTIRSTMELNRARSIVTREDLELWQSDTEGGLVNHPDTAECWTDPRRIINQVTFYRQYFNWFLSYHYVHILG